MTGVSLGLLCFVSFFLRAVGFLFFFFFFTFPENPCPFSHALSLDSRTRQQSACLVTETILTRSNKEKRKYELKKKRKLTKTESPETEKQKCEPLMLRYRSNKRGHMQITVRVRTIDGAVTVDVITAGVPNMLRRSFCYLIRPAVPSNECF